MLRTAGGLAKQRDDECVVGRDLLHAALITDGVVARTLVDFGIDPAEGREHVTRIFAGQRP
jgi:hypothetical protein